jgi:hypothetical protein
LLGALAIQEKEEFVLNDRATDLPAKLTPLERIVDPEGRSGRERVITDEAKGFAVY